jgi:hypothetical protein
LISFHSGDLNNRLASSERCGFFIPAILYYNRMLIILQGIHVPLER